MPDIRMAQPAPAAPLACPKRASEMDEIEYRAAIATLKQGRRVPVSDVTDDQQTEALTHGVTLRPAAVIAGGKHARNMDAAEYRATVSVIRSGRPR